MDTRMAELRKAAGYTQSELAEAIGATTRKVSYWETTRMFLDDAVAVADVLDVTLDELAGRPPRTRTEEEQVLYAFGLLRPERRRELMDFATFMLMEDEAKGL